MSSSTPKLARKMSPPKDPRELKRKQTSLTSLFGKVESGERQKKRPCPLSLTTPGSRFSSCPICSRSIPTHKVVSHASSCNDTPDGNSSVIKEKLKASRCVDKNPLHHAPVIIGTGTSAEEVASVPGLYIFEDFISNEEEAVILSTIFNENEPKWKLSSFNGLHVGKRWGVHCNLRERNVTPAEYDMPSFFSDVIFPKLLHLPPMKGCVPNEANAIEYRKSLGHYLVDHVDNRQLSKEPIANLSLAGSCYMTYTPTGKAIGCNTKDRGQTKVLLKPRTLQILVCKARYNYSHGIKKGGVLSERRVSITMRESPLSHPFAS